MSKKIIASAVLAAALFAGTSVTAAQAVPVAAVSAAKATVTAAQKKAVAAAVESIKGQAKEVDDKGDIANVATISAADASKARPVARKKLMQDFIIRIVYALF